MLPWLPEFEVLDAIEDVDVVLLVGLALFWDLILPIERSKEMEVKDLALSKLRAVGDRNGDGKIDMKDVEAAFTQAETELKGRATNWFVAALVGLGGLATGVLGTFVLFCAKH